jgi:transposase
MGPDIQQAGFVRAMVAAAETVAAKPSAPASGRMVIEIGKDRRVIVDAGVDAAALARVLAILERR